MWQSMACHDGAQPSSALPCSAPPRHRVTDQPARPALPMGGACACQFRSCCLQSPRQAGLPACARPPAKPPTCHPGPPQQAGPPYDPRTLRQPQCRLQERVKENTRRSTSQPSDSVCMGQHPKLSAAKAGSRQGGGRAGRQASEQVGHTLEDDLLLERDAGSLRADASHSSIEAGLPCQEDGVHLLFDLERAEEQGRAGKGREAGQDTVGPPSVWLASGWTGPEERIRPPL